MTAPPSAVSPARLILLWNRELRMLPDRSFVGGFFFRFVHTGDAGTNPGEPAQ